MPGSTGVRSGLLGCLHDCFLRKNTMGENVLVRGTRIPPLRLLQLCCASSAPWPPAALGTCRSGTEQRSLAVRLLILPILLVTFSFSERSKGSERRSQTYAAGGGVRSPEGHSREGLARPFSAKMPAPPQQTAAAPAAPAVWAAAAPWPRLGWRGTSTCGRDPEPPASARRSLPSMRRLRASPAATGASRTSTAAPACPRARRPRRRGSAPLRS